MTKPLQRVLWVMALLAGYVNASADMKNGFDLSGALVPVDEIFHGGPPKDGIPAIDHPKFTKAKEARFLRNGDRVLGVQRNGVAKAYPVAILNWHEIVNDELAGDPVTVTYCPLCGSGVAYRAEVDGKRLSFGVSGLLYNSDLLLYDRQSSSLWPQILAKAISGPLKGQRLEIIPLADTTWGDWRIRYPHTLLLSTDTGYRRDYARNPYAGYEERRELMFPMRFRTIGYHPKERVIGVELDGHFKAYPFVELAKTSGEVADTLAGHRLVIRFDEVHQSGAVFDKNGGELPSITAFWFAWYAFHPDTEVFRTDRDRRQPG